MALKPKISFTFPYRWLKEDREFLYKNLERMADGGTNKFVMNDALKAAMQNQGMFGPVAYFVRIKTHAYQPVSFTFTAKDAEKAFKNVLPHAKCTGVEKFFVQAKSQTSLPVMECELYY